MTPLTLVLILISVSLSSLAQISFKLGLVAAGPIEGGQARAASTLMILLTPQILFGLGLYGVGTLVWLTALNRVEVSQAYPFVGLGFVLTAVLGHLVFGDELSLQRILGILLVIVGIVLIAAK